MFKIYKYTNINDGKCYIGRTKTSLEDRAQSNGNNYRTCPRFYEAIKEFGWSAFVPEILDTAQDLQTANRLEVYYIDKYKSNDPDFGYNIAVGGYSGAVDAYSREIISKKAKERYKDKTKNPMYGKKHSEEAIKIMREKKTGANNVMYGRHWTETQRLKCGTKGKTLNLTDEHRERLREHARMLGKTVGLIPVRCIEDDAKFKSIVEAANAYGVSKSTLTGHLKGRQHTCAGKHFEYLD